MPSKEVQFILSLFPTQPWYEGYGIENKKTAKVGNEKNQFSNLGTNTVSM